MIQSSLLAMFYFLSLLWTFPGISGCTFPHIYNKNTSPQPYLGTVTMHLVPKPSVYPVMSRVQTTCPQGSQFFLGNYPDTRPTLGRKLKP